MYMRCNAIGFHIIEYYFINDGTLCNREGSIYFHSISFFLIQFVQTKPTQSKQK